VPILIGDELLHGRVSERALGLEVPHSHGAQAGATEPNPASTLDPVAWRSPELDEIAPLRPLLPRWAKDSQAGKLKAAIPI
jgi:hypothetical protein